MNGVGKRRAKMPSRGGGGKKQPSVTRTAAALAAALVAGLACSGTLPPLRGQMEVGRDGYAVFVAGGGAAGGDLYAVRTEGGAVVPITFSTVGETRPALSPDGVMLAFLRGASLRDSTPGTVWVMNLLNGAERELELPRGAGVPRRVGWSSDGQSLVVAADAGLYRSSAPPAPLDARPVLAPDRPAAESALAVLLGNPAFARAVPCAEPGALCVAGDTGAPGLLARDARDPARWGDDSVMFFRGDAVEIRPLGPGRARRLDWDGVPTRPRQMTVFLGVKREQDSLADSM
jgi:WD40 repeat protein